MTLEHLILLRHGETDWNRHQRLQGHRDIPLNAAGHHQAIAAAPSIVALRPSVIVSSDLGRARETASAVSVLTGIEPTVDARLRETSMGLWEGLTRDEVVAQWPDEWDRWRTTSAHACPPGGESRWQVAQRANEVVEQLDGGTASRALIVSHGGLIVGLTGCLLALPEDSWGTLIGVGNCHWVVLHRYAGAWRLHSYNAGLGGLVLPKGRGPGRRHVARKDRHRAGFRRVGLPHSPRRLSPCRCSIHNRRRGPAPPTGGFLPS